MTESVSRVKSRPVVIPRRTPWQLVTDPVVCYYAFIVTVLVLAAFGLLMVFSSSSVQLVAAGKSPFSQLLNQGLFFLVGVAVAAVAAFVPVRAYQRFSALVLLLAMVLQALTMTKLGVGSQGHTSWLKLGPVVFQPAEVMKLALCMWMPHAIMVGKRHHAGRRGRGFLVPAVCFAAAFLLILGGRDLGTGLVILLIGAVAIFAGGFDLKIYAVSLVIGIAGILGVFVVGSGNRMSRINALLGGCPADGGKIQDACWQSVHGLYALASGGLTGLGLGASREKWGGLPEAHNDFIFAIVGEELGFVGALAVVLCFAVIIWCLANIALRMRDQPYPRLVLVCVAAWLVGQALINILMVLEILPVIGIPLPFVSAGGTALVMCLAAAGVAVRMAREQDDIKAVFKR